MAKAEARMLECMTAFKLEMMGEMHALGTSMYAKWKEEMQTHSQPEMAAQLKAELVPLEGKIHAFMAKDMLKLVQEGLKVQGKAMKEACKQEVSIAVDNEIQKSKEAIAAMEASVSKVQENVEKNVHTWAEMAKDAVDKEVKECAPWIEVVKKNKGMPSNQMEVMNATLEEEAKRAKDVPSEYEEFEGRTHNSDNSESSEYEPTSERDSSADEEYNEESIQSRSDVADTTVTALVPRPSNAISQSPLQVVFHLNPPKYTFLDVFTNQKLSQLGLPRSAPHVQTTQSQATTQISAPIGNVGPTPSTVVHHSGLPGVTDSTTAPSTSRLAAQTSAHQESSVHFMSRARKCLSMDRNAVDQIKEAVNSIINTHTMHACTYESMHEEVLSLQQMVFQRDVQKVAYADKNQILERQVKDLKGVIDTLHLQLRESQEQLKQQSMVTTRNCAKCAQNELVLTTSPPPVSAVEIPPQSISTYFSADVSVLSQTCTDSQVTTGGFTSIPLHPDPVVSYPFPGGHFAGTTTSSTSLPVPLFALSTQNTTTEFSVGATLPAHSVIGFHVQPTLLSSTSAPQDPRFRSSLPSHILSSLSTSIASPAIPSIISSTPPMHQIQPNQALYSSPFSTFPGYHLQLPTIPHQPSPSQTQGAGLPLPMYPQFGFGPYSPSLPYGLLTTQYPPFYPPPPPPPSLEPQ
ncbi:hypothetical protein L7F22_029942 [Adiantum nelumboides]|nr:hypothetical protein [Adiantum nelumboides]